MIQAVSSICSCITASTQNCIEETKAMTKTFELDYGMAQLDEVTGDISIRSKYIDIFILLVIKTSALDYNGERYLISIINCVIFRL
jgi:hypothetical protein